MRSTLHFAALLATATHVLAAYGPSFLMFSPWEAQPDNLPAHYSPARPHWHPHGPRPTTTTTMMAQDASSSAELSSSTDAALGSSTSSGSTSGSTGISSSSSFRSGIDTTISTPIGTAPGTGPSSSISSGTGFSASGTAPVTSSSTPAGTAPGTGSSSSSKLPGTGLSSYGTPPSSSTGTSSGSAPGTGTSSTSAPGTTSSSSTAPVTYATSNGTVSATGTSTSTSASTASSASPTSTYAGQCGYWFEDIKHQGLAAFNSNSSDYQVFRNVKDFGAKGDGQTDDTAAINLAISSGGRCAPGACASTTTTPAVVYFPAGTYMISGPIIDYYYTQLHGNPNCLPTIKAFADFTLPPGGTGFLIDGDAYQSTGSLGYGATNVFWRQVRNFILDTTLVPAAGSIAGVHWPTGQATSLQNVVFELSKASGTQHTGVFIEEGSGGFMNDLIFNGGLYGLNVGNQQFTMRNLTFNGAVVAINQIWDWGWTYQGLHINDCSIGLNMSGGGSGAQSVGSVTLFDSFISNTPIGIQTAWSNSSQPPAAGSLILENVEFVNVPVAVQGPGGVVALGSTDFVAAWGQGISYTPTGPTRFQGPITPNSRPASLVQGGAYYERSKPQYEGLPLSSFVSARALGAKGDGRTDDTEALQSAINTALSQNKVLFLDHGDYLVTSTITLPAGSKFVGEAYSVILSSGSFFNDLTAPQPVVQIGQPGETGSIEWSDSIVSTRGAQAGAILFQYNLVAPSFAPSGLWDVHARVGGFAGSELQLADCPKTPNTTVTAGNIDTNCIAAYVTFHITPASAGLYLENVWLWVADHDVEDPALTQITVYAGRGLLDESATGPVWLVGTAVEHHVLYEYQFSHASNVFGGQIQTETAYYQPNPAAPLPFPENAALNDPVFLAETVTTANGTVIPAANGWGLRVVESSEVLIYGAGLYSFFDNYSTECSAVGNFESCQSRMASFEGAVPGVSVYNLNTVGVHWPVTVDGVDVVEFEGVVAGFTEGVAVFRPGV